LLHYFTLNDEYFLYDVESSSLFEIEKIVYDVLSGSASLEKDYNPEYVAQVKSELEQLKAEGLLDASAPTNVVAGVKSKEVKALCIHMSHDCNLRCKYCFAGTGAYHGERMHMSLEVAKASIDFLIANSGNRRNLEVDFFGGEPLMNLDVLKQTVEYAKEQAKLHNKVFKFTTTTNGVLLDKETSDYLNAEMENVVLSLDGRKEINDFHRPTVNGKGSFDVIVDKYKYFRSIRGDKSYYIRGTFTGANANFYDDVIAMADLGFDQVSVEPVVLPSDHELAIKPEQLQTICDNYEKLAVEYVKRRADEKTWFSFFHFVVDLENGPCYKKRLVGCGAGSEYMAITPDGSIYPCHQFAGEEAYKLGDVWNGVTNTALREEFRACNVYAHPECADCWAKLYCSGGCAANAYHATGSVTGTYQYGCELFKKRIECAIMMKVAQAQNAE